MSSPAAAETCRQPTFDELLKAESIPADYYVQPYLNRYASSYALISNAHEFVYSGYLLNQCPDGGAAILSLHIFRYDKAQQQWQHSTTSVAKGGSVTRLVRAGIYLLSDQHASPSRSYTNVFNEYLGLVYSIDGWILDVIDQRYVIYHQGMVHFAATHAARIGLFDLLTQTDRLLYGELPEIPVVDHVRSLQQATFERLGRRWCMAKLHSCNPDDIQTAFVATPGIMVQNGDLAFFMRYQAIHHWAWQELTGGHNTPYYTALIVVRNFTEEKATLEFHGIECVYADLSLPQVRDWVIAVIDRKPSIDIEASVCNSELQPDFAEILAKD